MDALEDDIAGGLGWTCPDCRLLETEEQRQRLKQLREAGSKIIVTTTPSVDGTVIETYIGIESVEFVIGTGVFSEIGSEFQDFFGLRSKGFENKLQKAKQSAMEALRMLAAEKGADAIVGTDLDYTEFSGNRVGLILNGTLVKLRPLVEHPSLAALESGK